MKGRNVRDNIESSTPTSESKRNQRSACDYCILSRPTKLIYGKQMQGTKCGDDISLKVVGEAGSTHSTKLGEASGKNTTG